MDDTDALRWRVDRLERQFVTLQAAFVQFSQRKENSDSRLGPLLALIYAFAHDSAWSVRELLEDARRADRGLWLALDTVVGDQGNPPIKLGRWLQRHEGVDADGLRLQRITRESNAWLYQWWYRRVVRVETATLFALPRRYRDDGPTTPSSSRGTTPCTLPRNTVSTINRATSNGTLA